MADGSTGRRVEKTRYLGHLGDQRVFELDSFSGNLAPRTLVEVEFTSVEAAAEFAPPAWFGMDVTDDKRLKNRVLAVHVHDDRIEAFLGAPRVA